MPRINENDLAVAVTKAEGLKKSISIAQVKEVIRCLKEELVMKQPSDIMKWLGL